MSRCSPMPHSRAKTFVRTETSEIHNKATTPIPIAIERARIRGRKTGRFIDVQTIIDIHKAVSSTMPKCAPYFDELKLYDTTNTPRLIATGGNNLSLKALDDTQKELEDFLNKVK